MRASVKLHTGIEVKRSPLGLTLLFPLFPCDDKNLNYSGALRMFCSTIQLMYSVVA